MAYRPDIVLITGATGDIGRAFAARFAALGCRLVLAGRDASKLAALPFPDSHTLCFDIGDRPAMERAIADLPEPFRAIDLLINNAGGALGLRPAQAADDAATGDDWDAMVASNVTGLMHMTRLILPGMAARGHGHVINIGSVAGSWPYPGGNVYCAVKAFTAQFSLALRADLAGTGVRVTNIEPGMVETEFSLKRFKGDAEQAKKVYDNAMPLTADDIAETAVWAATLPPRVNINRMEVMPTSQSFASLAVHRSAARQEAS